MLTSLTIKNFALIEKISLNFDQKLNVFTGQTGAGKSILIDALRIALGERINTSSIRDPQLPCLIEAVFDLTSHPNIKELEVFESFFEEDDQLIISRMFYSDGRSKVKVNGLNVAVGQLKEMGNHLVDFHGPHDHQMLLSAESHRGMLDRLIDFKDIKEVYREKFKEFIAIEKKINDLQEMAATRDREIDMLTHQVRELEQVVLDDQVCEELIGEQTRMDNAERLSECVSSLLQTFTDEASGTSEQFRKAFSPMKKLNSIDGNTEKYMDLLSQAQEINEQLSLELQSYSESLQFHPDEAQKIYAKCDLYDQIKRKYGPTLAEAKVFFEESKKKLELLSNFDQEDKNLKSQLEISRKNLKAASLKITEKRKKAAQALQSTIESELSDLGIKDVKFEARVSNCGHNQHGGDEVVFYISPNVGMDLKPLAEIVSSGEAARVMLALKKALVEVDPIPVLIFDEIDAQIGGRLGTVTGKKLKSIAEQRQVILITHLPQIASFADRHFKVLKTVSGQKAATCLEELDQESRVREMAQMMSGDSQSEISMEHAQELLVKAKNLR